MHKLKSGWHGMWSFHKILSLSQTQILFINHNPKTYILTPMPTFLSSKHATSFVLSFVSDQIVRSYRQILGRLLAFYNYKSPLQMFQALTRQRNARISVKRRQHLIDLINIKNFSLCRAARKLNIKFSTARLIFKKYEETGTFFNKNMRRAMKSHEPQVKLEEDGSDASSHLKVQQKNEGEPIIKNKIEEPKVKIEPIIYPFMKDYAFYCYGNPQFQRKMMMLGGTRSSE